MKKINLGKVLAENNMIVGAGYNYASNKQIGFLKWKLEEAGFEITYEELNEEQLTSFQASKLIDWAIKGLLK